MLTPKTVDDTTRAETAIKSSAAPSGWWMLPAVLLGAAVWCGLILAVW